MIVMFPLPAHRNIFFLFIIVGYCPKIARTGQDAQGLGHHWWLMWDLHHPTPHHPPLTTSSQLSSTMHAQRLCTSMKYMYTPEFDYLLLWNLFWWQFWKKDPASDSVHDESVLVFSVANKATMSVHDIVLYSWKYWRELNLAVEPKITITRILANLNLEVWYVIAIRICK